MDSATTSSTKIDIYQLVTDQIIAVMEQGVVPWQKPWADAGIPMNMLSKRQYRGINLWLLLTLNYERNLFLTWDQIKSVKGSVLAGEKGHIVVFWKLVKKQPEELDTKGNPKMIAMLRYYKVFNIAQCREIPQDLIPVTDESLEPLRREEEWKQILDAMPNPPLLSFKGKQAHYDVEKDEIVLPQLKTFKNIEGYYDTFFHELVHSTGAEKRLGRETIIDMVPFGVESYAMEELIAEMGSAYLCQTVGILPKTITNAAAYLNNWLEVFKKDKRFLISASGQAQRAIDFIFNKKEEAKEEIEEDVESVAN